MDDLLAVIAELGLELHPDRVSTVAAKIETLGSVEQFALTKSSFGPRPKHRRAIETVWPACCSWNGSVK